MNGKLFEKLHKLQVVNLADNECIRGRFKCDSVFGFFGIAKNTPCNQEIIQSQTASCSFSEFIPSGNDVSCSFKKCTLEEVTEELCCTFDNSTSIGADDFTISNVRNDVIEELRFDNNPKIKFLPIGVFLKFDKLQSFHADHCAISNISKANFQYLEKLRNLDLAYNNIETIKRDTFEGLSRLTSIKLSRKPIEKQNQIIAIIHR